MQMRTLFPIRILAVLLFTLIAACFSLDNVNAEELSPQDTPIQIVNDPVLDWSVGNGLIYWSTNCQGEFAGESAELHRRPVNSGVVRTIATINNPSKCRTFFNQLSSSDGLYYFDDSEARIERISLGQPYSAVAIKTLALAEFPSYRRNLIESGDYLYWIITLQKILRTRKDGSGPIEIVASPNTIIADMLIADGYAYWVDDEGLNRISYNCTTLPCNDSAEQIVTFDAATRGVAIAYQPPKFQIIPNPAETYRIYWVQRNTSNPSTYTIKYCSLGGIFDCRQDVIGPSDISTVTADVDHPVTFYTGTRGWWIGKPIFVEGKLYWTEAEFGNDRTGNVKRRAADATTPVNLADTLATNQYQIDDDVYSATGRLYFARVHGIYHLSISASALTVRDFTASAIEVTQGIQNLANGVPLVASKTTYVRAYGKQTLGADTPYVEVRLKGFLNGFPLPGSPLSPINPGRRLITNRDFDRANIEDSWNFLLPNSWTSVGVLSLQLEIDPRNRYVDSDRTDNTLTQSVFIQYQPPVCVVTVPVRTNTPLPSVHDPNFWGMVGQFNRRWPIPETIIFFNDSPFRESQLCWYGIFPYECGGPYEFDEDGDRRNVLAKLRLLARTTYPPERCSNAKSPVHYMGMVHPDANTGGVLGSANTEHMASWVRLPPHLPNPFQVHWKSMRPGMTMAHELAHNYGRKHVNCDLPAGDDNYDTAYPYPPCQLDNSGQDKHYGFDVASQSPIPPDTDETGDFIRDFMAYGVPRWVSDYTWKVLLEKFAQAQINVASSQPTLDGDSLLVVGIVDDTAKQGTLSYVYTFPTATLPPETPMSTLQAAETHHGAEPHATYKVRLSDFAGSVLSETLLNIDFIEDHDPASISGVFAETIPTPSTPVAKIELLADSTVIATLQPGAGKPTIAIQQPTAASVIDDDLLIQWTASDPDVNDRLLYLVQYSYNNGAHWHTLVSDFPGSDVPTTTLSIEDVMGLHASSGQSGLIRVLASDGINTAIATSQPFTLKNRKPIPFITVPVAGQSFPAYQPIVLSGGANDTEDGGLTEANLHWLVDGVPVGTGSNLLLAGVAPGQHIAVLSATDSVSTSTSVQVQFEISPLGIPQLAAPTMDGFCEDSAYLSATNVQLDPYPDGSQATVRLLRTTSDLWACFSGMITGTNLSGALAGLHIDVNLNRSELAQPDDLAFFAGEDGDVFTAAGNGANGFTGTGVGGLTAQVTAGGNTWNAELRIDGSKIGGLDHQIGLKLGHHSVTTQGDDYHWPYQAVSNSPKSWATATLGSQPLITLLEPFTATIGSTPFTMTVEGEGFVKGGQIVWNGIPLSTTFVSSKQLIANVGAVQVASAEDVAIVVRNPAPSNAQSNQIAFEVIALPPSISSLSPNSVLAGSNPILLTINGTNFTDNAKVLWNGELIEAKVIDSNQLTVQIDVEKLAVGQNVGVVVQNQLPDVRISNMQEFVITPLAQQPAQHVYLPLVSR